ncbi:factor arrest protein 10 [Bimuria novae-zelandiae CBS 107.79]|uniref:Factor arrest protein 10 n=1 Tax=Bimuria novae-zelandiae CBS 107.79 TaxID=1447943 RepID=A0A6A5ULA6_9PLEO|nr:factor arrest protein 10 [Bimuria novae-zelandiae CBS 107.79]
MPRKSAQRSNSSSSLSSQASSSSTISTASSSQTNGVGAAPAADGSTWAARKKAPRGIWPATKTEPIVGIANGRSQPLTSTGQGPSATTTMTQLHPQPAPLPSQHPGTAQSQSNGAPRTPMQEAQAILYLVPMNGTFERKTITVPFFPDVLRIGRQTNNKTIPTPQNGYFDSKVLSRQHAEIWADRNGKIWIRDVKSSNGTFVNGQRLSQENRDSDPHELREQDMLELGIDIVSEDQKTIVHHKVAARVEHAGIYPNTGNMADLNFGDMDGQQMSNMVGPGGQQQMVNMRGRTPSQGSINSQRLPGPAVMGNGVGAMQQPRHPNFWLQPITMEQVVKKLNAEIKAARQQSQDLQQAHSYINAILIADPKEKSTKNSPINSTKISPINDVNLKARFSDPPAPPPQQPLPEKPDAPSLKRIDSEKFKSMGSPVRSDAHLSTLNDALQTAKKEIESQGVRLRDLEAMLTEERRAREDAEERANRLERERLLGETPIANGDIHKVDADDDASETETVVANGSASSNVADVATARLQQRLDTMMTEMNEMKIQMDQYRQRAETAEADRRTLAEMIENIRNDNAKMSDKAAKRRSRSGSGSAQAEADNIDRSVEGEQKEDGEITIINEKDVGNDTNGTVIRKSIQDGRPAEHGNAAASNKTSQALATRANRNELALLHSAPAISMLTVVALGVAVMAWLNDYPKVDR